MVKIARLDDAFLEVLLTANKLSRRSVNAKKKKKRKGEKKFLHTPEPKCLSSYRVDQIKAS